MLLYTCQVVVYYWELIGHCNKFDNWLFFHFFVCTNYKSTTAVSILWGSGNPLFQNLKLLGLGSELFLCILQEVNWAQPHQIWWTGLMWFWVEPHKSRSGDFRKIWVLREMTPQSQLWCKCEPRKRLPIMESRCLSLNDWKCQAIIAHRGWIGIICQKSTKMCKKLWFSGKNDPINLECGNFVHWNMKEIQLCVRLPNFYSSSCNYMRTWVIAGNRRCGVKYSMDFVRGPEIDRCLSLF